MTAPLSSTMWSLFGQLYIVLIITAQITAEITTTQLPDETTADIADSTMEYFSTTIENTENPTTPEVSTTTLTALSQVTVTPTSFPSCTLDNIMPDRVFISIPGNFTVSVFTLSSTDVLDLVVTRINRMKLIHEGNATLGLRGFQVINLSRASEFLVQEIHFRKECMPESLGIFVTREILNTVPESVKSSATNLWTLEGRDDVLFPQVTHLMYDLPWGDYDVDIEVKTSSDEEGALFKAAAKAESLCLGNTTANETLVIAFGNKVLDISKPFPENAKIFAVPFGIQPEVLDYLPNLSYAFAENILELSELNETINQLMPSTNGVEPKILSSDFIITSTNLVTLSRWLNASFCIPEENCEEQLLKSIALWESLPKLTLKECLLLLNMDAIENSMNYDLVQKIVANETSGLFDTRLISSVNFVTNVSTIFKYDGGESLPEQRLGHTLQKFCPVPELAIPLNTTSIEGIATEEYLMVWRIIPEAWVAAGLTTSILGIVMSLAILVFILSRVCMQDVLEGNPVCGVLLLLSLVLLFGSFIPFSIEYTSDMTTLVNAPSDVVDTWNSFCAIRIFILTMSYCITFSILLCRAIMLASIGGEGGFLSHVNGYIQSVVCVFSILVQVGLSTQLLIIMHSNHNSISCNSVFYGNWLWGLIGYNAFLLALLILLAPFYFRSQRNYHEGILILTGALLTLVVWSTWIPLSMLGHQWRLFAVPLGAQLTGWAILGGILIPRSFLMVRGIARSDLAQVLPSLTSLAFAQANNQFASEQSVYECVNPAMRQRTCTETTVAASAYNYNDIDSDPERCPSPSEIPTLPLRGASRGNNMHYIQYNQQDDENLAFQLSPSKITRF